MHPLQSYQEFFPFYLNEHSQLWTRVFHYVGTTVALICIASFLVTLNAWFLLFGLVTAYGLAWVSHFTIEHNSPATFKYPFWSYLADHHMLYLAVTGGLKPRLSEAKKVFQNK